ncbi:hypothetical protein S83_058760 [Arachis hypogaea]
MVPMFTLHKPQRRPLQLSEQGQVLEIAIEPAANVVLDLKDSLNDWMYRGTKAILEDIKNYPLNDAAETVNEIGSTIRRAMGGSRNKWDHPIGALNPDRLKKFQERYASFNDPVIPKFRYGSHYSSAGTVLYYLVRVEPFTTLAIKLQGGKFDHANRMFSDVSTTWNGVLEDMSDVKELLLELFYLPALRQINYIATLIL